MRRAVEPDRSPASVTGTPAPRKAAEFLAEYPLRVVEKTERDTLSGVTRYSYRQLMGDHAVVPALVGETASAELEAGSLYLVDRTGEPYLLRPFLTRRQCPKCGGWETFFLDTYDRQVGVCTLKSLEKGHTVEDDQIAQVLRQMSVLN